jgi:hypothetical protein
MITYPRAADNDGYDILIDGIRAGSISKGWLRLGGAQWVISRPNCPQTGRATLAEAKAVVARAAAKQEA